MQEMQGPVWNVPRGVSVWILRFLWFCLSAVLMAAQMRVLRRVRAVQEPAIRLCPHAIAILTLIFRSCNLMIAVLLERDTQDCVIEALNMLYATMGAATFRKLCGVILTDRGMEFRNVYGIEHSENGKLRTQVFYCDPYCSWQKGSVEKNHEFIRQVLPKKTSFDWLTQDAVDLMMSHINSYPRARLNDKSPFEVAEFLLGKHLLTRLNLQKIPAKDVILRPTLLKVYRIANLQQEPIHQ